MDGWIELRLIFLFGIKFNFMNNLINILQNKMLFSPTKPPPKIPPNLNRLKPNFVRNFAIEMLVSPVFERTKRTDTSFLLLLPQYSFLACVMKYYSIF
jgi:hypothetical protein